MSDRPLRCRATTYTIDGPVPYTERCVLIARHDGRHECGHGFHFDRDERRPVGEARYDVRPWSAVAAVAAVEVEREKRSRGRHRHLRNE